MKSYLRTQEIDAGELGEKVTIREMSAQAQIAIAEAARDENPDQLRIAGMTVKYCIAEFQTFDVDEILANLSIAALTELAEAVADFSNLSAAKNSNGDLSDNSYSDSPLN